jgi:signal transduction histidine kinase
VASLRTGLLAIDPQGRIALVSAEAVRVLLGPDGPAPARLLGQPLEQALCERPELARLLVETLDGEERPWRAELRLAGGAADGRVLGYTRLALRDDEGRVAGAAMLFRDLTAFEREDEQARVRDRLLALGEMAAGLAHEIRTPLASLEMLGGLLKRRLGDRPEELALVEELLAELRSMDAAVRASLDYVRPVGVAPAPADARALLEEALRRARVEARFAGRVVVEAEPGLPALRVDGPRVVGALVELVRNAVRAMATQASPGAEERGRLVLRAAAGRAGEAVLEVSDTGPGVPAGIRERIFHPFFTTRAGGTGLGLAQVQKVVAEHGGHVELVEPPGGGACFRVHLPAGPAP